MLKDFVKLETFLTVARERSFSKASAKLGISRPAVTQQIKFIEKYLACKVIERKKNGIKLTNEGDELYKIATRIDKHNGINADYIEIMLLNTTSNKVQITWQNELWFDGKCQTCEQFNKKEYEHKIILNGSESLEGDCVSRKNQDLLIFINFNDKPNVPKLSDFELKYLKVDPIIE